MENSKILLFENKINEFIGHNSHLETALLNNLSVEKILTLSDEFSLEWQGLIKAEHLDQDSITVQKITNFLQYSIQLRNLFLEAKSKFINITLYQIKAKEEELGFAFLTEEEFQAISDDLTSIKQNIRESIDLLSNELITEKLCLNYNEIKLHAKLESMGLA